MAMNNMMVIAAAPPLPMKCTAAAGGTKPEPASEPVTGRSSATEDRPMAVAREKGMVNHTRPPRRYPLVDDEGFAAIALCQYDWSTNTVPKLPTMLMMPKMIPPFEIMVRYDPPRLSTTGPHDWPSCVCTPNVQFLVLDATACSWSYTAPGEPRGASPEAYTSMMKVSRMTKIIAVWMYDAMNVAFRPPAMVYAMTPTGIRKPAVAVSMPVKALTVAAPPKINKDVTMMFVRKQK
mmetsp:Transcript_5608/g.18494  ORF Transcript_5608/g.18494 Transcript_5608/m.18494 type:complete len:235 (+) Transcript_5608:6190-6894(+)